MARIYSEKELIKRIEEQSNDAEFYRIPALNYTGKTSEGCHYTEIIAKWLIEKWDSRKDEAILLQKANMQEPEKEQSSPIHLEEKRQGKIKYSEGSNRDEENIAKRLMEQEVLQVIDFPNTEVVDYQVPINRVWHSTQGKADLILVNERETIIGELKDDDSRETLLRAMVEAKTYTLKIVNYSFAKERFIRSYHHESIQPAVLFFENTQPWNDYLDMKAGNRIALQSLANKWDMLFFLVKTVGDIDKNVWKNNTFILEKLPSPFTK